MSATLFVSNALAQTDPNSNSSATAADPISPGQQQMLIMLEEKVRRQPDHSESWRSLGRVQLAIGRIAPAQESFERAAQLDPFNAAAHFDLGQLLSQTGHPEEALAHFQQVYQIAPLSDYSKRLRAVHVPDLLPAPASDAPVPAIATLSEPIGPTASGTLPIENQTPGPIPSEFSDPLAQAVSYEIKTFDGSDDLQDTFVDLQSQAVAPDRRLRLFFETGLLYNTNVTLTPISRELAQNQGGSFQGFANPDIDFKLINSQTDRLGPMFRGYFTLNDDQNSDFNLASYQPGLFYERDFQIGLSEAIGRTEYVLSTDFFDHQRVGQRHAATFSLTLIRPDLDALYGYLRVAQTDFENDGADPDVTSLDGTSLTLGISRFHQTGWESMPMASLGCDLESADTEGSDYRYRSLNVHSSTSVRLSERWQWIPTGGIGYRDYSDYTGPISRNEFFWRLHSRLQFQVTPLVAWSLVVGHDRFASDNADFDTQRTEGGIVCTLIR